MENKKQNLWAILKDFFNMKDWVKTLRSIPSIVVAMTVLANVLMNILANKSIIDLPLLIRTDTGLVWLPFLQENWREIYSEAISAGGWRMGIIQDAGIIVSWVGFLTGDLIVKAYGPKNGIRVNLTSLAISLFTSIILTFSALVPGDWSPIFDPSINSGNIGEFINASCNAIMGNVWYVILGSAFASAISLTCNGLIQGLLLKKVEKKHGDKYAGFLIASTGSTVIAQFIDNVVFATLISVHFFGWNWYQVLCCSAIGAIFELLIEVVFTPLTYKIYKIWDKAHIGVKYMEKA